MHTADPTATVSLADVKRKLYALIEEADNSCSESEDFMRGAWFIFDALVAETSDANVAD